MHLINDGFELALLSTISNTMRSQRSYAMMSLLLDTLISSVTLSPIFIPSSSNSLTVILKVVDSDDMLFLPPNVLSIASDIFFGKFFKSSNEVIGIAATPKGFSGSLAVF